MQFKILQKTAIIGITANVLSFLIILFLFLSFCLSANYYIYYHTVANINYPVGLPVRIEIPNINVDAAVVPVGVTKDGLMDLPAGHQDTGWFKLGPRPGENGSAVIDGHVGYWHNGDKTVFNDLNKLKEGDEIYIKDENGKIISFVVQKISIYNQNADASNVFNSNDGKAHLNLITCVGVWDGNQETYPNRLVIFADKKSN